MGAKLLEINDLTLNYKTKQGQVNALNEISFKLKEGSVLGLVGESGCGKTTLANTILRLLPENAYIKKGEVHFRGNNLLSLSEKELKNYRWDRISMIFQAAMNAMSPVYKVGEQIIEVIQLHAPDTTTSQARKKVKDLFNLVGLDVSRIDHYPHQYSGGMKQRAIIAMALACNPDLIIADEPTTALDVIVQDQILKKINEIRKDLDMSMIYISHDIAVIAEVSEIIGIMYAGELIEFGPTVNIFKNPLHPYTAGLMASFPSIAGGKEELKVIPGEPPSLTDPPSGCKFHPRCSYATDKCRKKSPPQYWANNEDEHFTYCWHPLRD